MHVHQLPIPQETFPLPLTSQNQKSAAILKPAPLSLPETENSRHSPTLSPQTVHHLAARTISPKPFSNPEKPLFTHGLLQQPQHVNFRRGLGALATAVICNFRRSIGLRPRSSRYGVRNPSPLAISSGLFKFLRCLELSSVELGLDLVPFNGGCKLAVSILLICNPH